MKCQNKTKGTELLMILAILMASCSTSKYTASEKVYKKQAKGFANIIKATPPLNQEIATVDLKEQAWVGSVNFGIRKPNFVILHHTAQKFFRSDPKDFHHYPEHRLALIM